MSDYIQKYRPNQKIWYIKIDKYKDKYHSYSSKTDGIKVEETKILGLSPYKIVLDDLWFTTVDNEDRENYRKDKKWNTYLDEISVSIRTNNNILGDGVFVRLYSTKPPTKKLLDKMVARALNEIDKEYGFLFKNVEDELWTLVEEYDI